ncbi:Protein of unknown function [Gryllus bimaculatus]|nr:Protein of unknown function [Gryllus bimaculatus]
MSYKVFISIPMFTLHVDSIKFCMFETLIFNNTFNVSVMYEMNCHSNSFFIFMCRYLYTYLAPLQNKLSCSNPRVSLIDLRTLLHDVKNKK